MINKIYKELMRKMELDINKDYLHKRGCFDLQMKKFVLDEEFENDEFSGDCLTVVYPNSYSNCFKVLPEFPKEDAEHVLKFACLRDVAEWICKTYC